MQMAAAQRCSGARAITAQRSPSTTCSGTGMAALELSQQSLTRGAGTGAARRAPSHCRQCSGPWQRWQQRSQYCAAELSLAQAASYASCGAAVTAALEPHWRSVRTSARASAAGGQHQGPAGSAPTVPRREHSGAGQMIDGHRLHNAAALRTPLRQPLLGPRGADNPPDCVRPSPGDL